MPCAGLNNPAHGIRFCVTAASAKTRKRLHPKPDVAFNMAERKGFEPLRALGALHDFQSCALDQLSHLSIFFCAAPDCMSYYNNVRGKCQALFCGFLKVFRGCGRHGQIVCKLCAQTAYFARFILLQTAAYSAKTIRASSRSAYRQRALCGHAGENYHAVRREDSSCIPFFAIWRSLS